MMGLPQLVWREMLDWEGEKVLLFYEDYVLEC